MISDIKGFIYLCNALYLAAWLTTHDTKRLLARDGEDFVQAIHSTPFF